MSEEAKIRFLFQAIQHKDLLVAVEALCAQQTAGSNLTYTACCNHLTTAVSQLPEYIQRNRTVATIKISDIKTGPIYNADGSINATGHIDNWDKIPMSKKCIVFKERKRLGVKFNVDQGKVSGKGKKDASSTNTINQLRRHNQNLKRRIKALKQSDTDSEGKEVDIDDASDEFGGKKSKKRGGH